MFFGPFRLALPIWNSHNVYFLLKWIIFHISQLDLCNMNKCESGFFLHHPLWGFVTSFIFVGFAAKFKWALILNLGLGWLVLAFPNVSWYIPNNKYLLYAFISHSLSVHCPIMLVHMYTFYQTIDSKSELEIQIKYLVQLKKFPNTY